MHTGTYSMTLAIEQTMFHMEVYLTPNFQLFRRLRWVHLYFELQKKEKCNNFGQLSGAIEDKLMTF